MAIREDVTPLVGCFDYQDIKAEGDVIPWLECLTPKTSKRGGVTPWPGYLIPET